LLWTAVNYFTQGILAWVLGNRSAKTFETLWETVKQWKSYFYVTDGETALQEGFLL
jgi:IS1 family transposase